MAGSLANVYSSLQRIYQLWAMNKHYKSIKRCCKQFSSCCCYLLLHLLDIYSNIIWFGCISKTPLIEAKWKTLNAYCFVCGVKVTQRIHIVQIPQASKLTPYDHCWELSEMGSSYLWLRWCFDPWRRIRQFTLSLDWSGPLTAWL